LSALWGSTAEARVTKIFGVDVRGRRKEDKRKARRIEGQEGGFSFSKVIVNRMRDRWKMAVERESTGTLSLETQ
jgi:hypothetical protein